MSLLATPALAANCIWNPATGNWATAADWSCGAAPGAADTATIGGGKAVTLNSAQSILNLGNAGSVNIDAFLLSLGGGGSTTNTGIINVGGASTATLQVGAGHNINNAGGVINVGNGSGVNQFGSTISGGTINTTGAGALFVFSSAGNFLSGVTLNGTLDLASIANSRQRIINGATLNGAANIANGGILSLDSASTAGGNQTIGGNATLNLNDAGARLAIEGTGSTTLASGVVLRGQGNVGQALNAGGNNTLINNGRISADVSGGTLNLTPPASGGGSSIANNNLMDARGGGTLLLSTNINNAAGQINAQNGSVVQQNGITITGGTLASTGSGVIRAASSANNFLDGVTLNGTLDLTTVANSRQRLVNTTTLGGAAINVGNGGILSLDSGNSVGGSATLGGTGVINLNDPGARLAIEGTGTTALASGITVRGQGNVGQALNTGGNNTLTSSGLISADVNGGTLNIVAPANGGGSHFVNNGTLQAINGATLLLSTNITANAGSQIIAGAGSAVVQNGVTLNGVINASGSGVFTAVSSANNFLDSVNFAGTLDLTSIANSRQRIVNGATLNGTVNIANGGILSLDSANTTGGNQAIGGSATINLNDPGARLAIDGTGTTTLASGITVRGQGNIGQAINVGGNNTLISNGLISSDVNGGTLNIVAPANGGGSHFVNNGTLQAINGATLLLSTNITANTGSQIIAGAGSSIVQNGVTLNGVINVSGSGVFTAVSSTNNFLDGITLTGTLDNTSIANSRQRIINGATLNGAVNIANSGIVSLDSANTAGGNQTIGGGATFNLNDASARLAIDGTGTTTLASGVVVRGQGNLGQAINVGGNNTLINNGRISADVSGGTLNVTPPANGGGSSIVNNNLMDARGGGTLLLSTSINNAAGQINAQNGSVVHQNGITITGGTLASSGTGVIRASSNTNNFLDGVMLNGTLDMATVANSRQRLVNTTTLGGGAAINVSNGGILSLDSGNSVGGSATLGGTGVINLNDPGARLAIDGTGTTALASGITVRGQGNIGQAVNTGGNNTLSNNGTILADGGTLTVSAPASGGGSSLTGTGTLQTNGGTLNLATGNASTQGRLAMGAAGSALSLAQNLTITGDYTNAQAGSGNSFDRRAGVSGAGAILAGGNATQAITGATVSNGATSNATLTIGSVRVGATTYNYQVANTGSTGPTLRGAIQTNVNGASLNDARLSGSGVTAGNYSTGGPGSNTGNLGVTFTAASAGALAPLSGPQVLNLTSNFSNIADQKLNIVLGSGAAAYNAAVGAASSPVQVANQRIGGSNTAAVTVLNAAAPGAFSEDLNVSIGATSAGISGAGSVTGRLAGSSSGGGAISVGVDTTSAGARSGTVTLNYQTAGTVGGVSNGLGVALANAPQSVAVNGNVYQAAAGAIQSAPLNFGTVQVGQVVSQNLVVRNTASGAAGFVEDLHASFATGTGTGTGGSLITGTGALNGILAGSNSTAGNGTMTVSLNTAAVGAVNGSILVNYFTAGAVNGVSNGLGTAAVGSQGYGVAGSIEAVASVINQASPLINNPNIDLGAVRVGASAPTANVSITNQATLAPQAALNASISSGAAPITASGSFNLLNPGASSTALQVGLNTAVAGNFTGANAGSATIALVSDASNVGGCAPNCQLTLASQTVTVAGKVYTAAAAELASNSLNFGIVHKGSVAPEMALTISNSAPVTALNDTLKASVTGASGPFLASGSLGSTGLAAGASDSSSLKVGVSTAVAGVFTGSATVKSQSHNADMSDLNLSDASVALQVQVNNYADPKFGKKSGAGVLTRSGSSFILDFGSITQGSTGVTTLLDVLNGTFGSTDPMDLLDGLFAIGGVDDVTLTGFDPFSDLAGGSATGDLGILLDTADLGSFNDIITLHGIGHNASGYSGAVGDITLVLMGNIVAGGSSSVPEPGSLVLVLLAGGGMWLLRVKRRSAS